MTAEVSGVTLESVLENDAAEQPMVPVYLAMLESLGVSLPLGSPVLDFGCGLGRHVREFRAAGFDAEGVDIPLRPLVDGFKLVDSQHLHFSRGGRFPFSDHTFAFCCSASTLEHVADYDTALREMARVLRPGAWAIHVFPSRWRLIEPHRGIPFGCRFQGKRWLRFWTGLGIRDSHQKGMSSAQAAEESHQYLRTGTNYLSGREIRSLANRYFSEVRFGEAGFVHTTTGVSRVSRLVDPLLKLPGVAALYRTFHTRVVLLRAEGPSRDPSTEQGTSASAP